MKHDSDGVGRCRVRRNVEGQADARVGAGGRAQDGSVRVEGRDGGKFAREGDSDAPRGDLQQETDKPLQSQEIKDDLQFSAYI